MKPFIFRMTWKKMGFNAYVPLIAAVFLIGVVAISKGDFKVFLPLMELVFPLLSAWWVLFSLNDALSEEGNELLFSLPVPRWQLGLLPVLFFYLFYFIVLIVILFGAWFWIDLKSLWVLGVQFASQAFFYSSLAFLAMVATRNIGWSLVLLAVYLSFALLTARSPFLLDIYLHNARPVSIEEMGSFLKKTWIFSVVFMVNAQCLLSMTTRYKT